MRPRERERESERNSSSFPELKGVKLHLATVGSPKRVLGLGCTLCWNRHGLSLEELGHSNIVKRSLDVFRKEVSG